MSIKTKLSLGLGFLFAIILLLGGMGIFYLYSLSDKSKDIIKDNYESLEYSQHMLQLLENLRVDSTSIDLKKKDVLLHFEGNLQKQEANITEIGEKQSTQDIRTTFNQLKTDLLNETFTVRQLNTQISSLNIYINKIIELNLQAIARKNNHSNAVARNAILYMSLVCTFAILITLTFIINFPGYIANPVKELTESIKQITQKNYEQRLNFESDDEFGELATAFNEMAQKLDEFEHSNLAEILFQKKRIEAIINNMIDPIIGLDDKSNILFANAEAVNILGISLPDIINKYAPDIALTNDLFRTILSSNKGNAPLKIFHDGKESYYVKDQIEVGSDGNIIGKVYILKNVTDFKELDAAKTNFIATISHELKTPIASIKMSTNLLEDNRIGTLNKEQYQLLQSVKEDSDRLLKITSELLNITQAESGQIQLNIQPIVLKDVIDYAVEVLKVQAEQKKVTIQIALAEGLPNAIADKDKLTWVLTNVLVNAIRYSPEHGKITIVVIPGKTNILISVSDEGPGIPLSYKDRIFDRYFQVPGSNGAGTGLGLAISKEFMQAQGGSIYVGENTPHGTVMTLEIKAA